MRLTDEQIENYRIVAFDLGLDGRELLCEGNDLIRTVCNGIGSDAMGSTLRGMLDALHPAFILPSVIHDLRYWFWDGTETSFKSANAEFASNGCKVAKARYSWYDPRRYLAYHNAAKYKAILDLCGHSAAASARASRIKQEERK